MKRKVAISFFLLITITLFGQDDKKLKTCLILNNIKPNGYFIVINEKEYNFNDSLIVQLEVGQEIKLSNRKWSYVFKFQPTVEFCESYQINLSQINKKIIQRDLKMCDSSTQRQTLRRFAKNK